MILQMTSCFMYHIHCNCLFHKHMNTFVVEYRHNGQLHIQLDTMPGEAVTKLLVPPDQEPKAALMKDSSKE